MILVYCGEAVLINMNKNVREARSTDVAEIMKVIDAAKRIMRQSGNMNQWGEGYPSEAVIISDMEIDSFCGENYESIAQKWQRIYAKAGLTAPKLIWWNVDSREGRVLARQDENVGFVSGYGVGPFKNLQSLIEKDAYTAMVEILSQDAFTWN